MADIIKPKAAEVEEAPTQKIRITLTSTKVVALEKVCSELKSKASSRGLKVKGPVRLPTKKLNLVVRKAPSGEGTNTYDRWQMRIHKRLIDFHASADILKEITKIQIEPGVDVEVTMVE